jgi:hypothetical protein
MEKYNEFKSEVDKFIDFMNSQVNKYNFKSDEEYDDVVDKTIIEYYRDGNRTLIFYDMEYFEENLEDYDGVNPYSITHRYTDEWGEPRDKTCPREHTLEVESVDCEYEAIITTIALRHVPYLYKKRLTEKNIIIPHFFLESITKKREIEYEKKHIFEIQYKDRYNYDPLK